MKRIAILMIVCFSLQLAAQETKPVEKTKPFFGLKAGLNVHPTKDDDGDTHYSLGYQIGSTLTVPMSSKFSFQPELLLQYIVSEYDFVDLYSNGSVTGESKTKSLYLIIPLDFSYAVSKKVNLELGGNVSYMISGKQKVTRTNNINGVLYVDEFNYSADSNTKKLGFGVNLGSTFHINEKLYTGLRYTLFISKYQSADDTLSNSVFALSMGYHFR